MKKEKYTVNFARTKVGNSGDLFEENKSKKIIFLIEIRFFRF